MTFKIDQAFISEFVDQFSGSIEIAHENVSYTPTAGTAYAELIMAQNAREMISYADSDEVTGVFRVILRYPVETGSGAAKTQADSILSHFSNAKRISYSGQEVTILSGQREPGLAEDGWYKLVVTLRFWARLAR